ncbi:MAG: lipase maturation factor family protein [Myxococcota bacterium]|nr:lipase maturation factor family protein [Myxococcota bacterium]
MTATYQNATHQVTVPLGAGRRLPRWIFFRLLGLVYLIAFWSLWDQLGGLIGYDGIAPADRWLAHVQSAGHGAEPISWWKVPTLCWWLGAGEDTLNVLVCAGCGLSVGLIVGIWPRATLFGLWALYLSLFTVSAPFLNFQWDILLLETTVVAFFYAPTGLYPRVNHAREPSSVAIWLLRLLLFKLMLSSGIVKLLSGDQSWLDLTALDFHFWTQPIPHPLSWYAHHGGETARQAGVLFNHFVELFVPWLIIFNPRGLKCVIWFLACGGLLWLGYGEYTLVQVAVAGVLAAVLGGRISPGQPDWSAGRTPAACLIIVLMVSVALSGNYGFFNLLTIALAMVCLDDASIYAFVPNRLLSRLPQRESHTRPCGPILHSVAILAALLLVPLNGLQLLDLASRQDRATAQNAVRTGQADLIQTAMTWLVDARQSVHGVVGGFALVNSYGLFRTMTKTRPELLVEGSRDGQTWQRYRFKYKPSQQGDALRFAGVHMPRLDWQMWFAALYPRCSTRWFFGFLEALLEGSPSVRALLAEDPFADAPPRYLRVKRASAVFTTAAQRRDTGNAWRFEAGGEYCPIVDRARLSQIKTRRHRR